MPECFCQEDLTMAQMQSLKPARKVSVAAATAGATSLVIWLLSLAKVTVPGYVAVALQTVLTFVVSYLVPPSENDGIVTS
jgi:hypothetical protein